MPTTNTDGATADQIEFDLEQLEAGNTEQMQSQGESAADAAVVAEARVKGWVPRDQFKGDPAQWVDASTFVDKGKKFNHVLQNKVANLESKLERFQKTADQFKVFHEESMARKDAELTEAIKTLRLQRAEANRDGDDETALVLEDRIDTLKEEQRQAKEAAKAVPAEPVDHAANPVMQEWAADGNQWFLADLKMQKYAVALADELVANGESLRGRPFLDKVTAMMKEEFPHKFGNPLRNRAGSVESGSAASASAAGGKTERDLPAVDRKLMNDFIKEGWTTKDKFLSEYFSR